MENKKSNTGLVVLVTILFMISLGLGGFIAYDKLIANKKVDTKEEKVVETKKEEKKEEAKYTFDDVKGVYYFEEQGEEDSKFIYRLSLNENGLYRYEKGYFINTGSVGYYVIENDEIKLYQLFTHGSDAALVVNVEPVKTVKIISKDEILDESPKAITEGIEKKYDKVSLKRNNDYKMTDFEGMFNNMEFINNVNRR